MSSKKVSLAIKPLLLYYGCVSLSQSLYLLKLNGEYSLDKLRQNNKHNHHGLELDKSFENTISGVSTTFPSKGATEIEYFYVAHT